MGSERRRDRHGRGGRRELLPPYALVGGRRVALPGWRGPRESVEALVRAALEPLMGAWGEELPGLVVTVEDVPPEVTTEEGVVADTAPGASVPLARALPGTPPRLVVYRRPLELRAQDRQDLRELVEDVVVEAVAELLGRDPDEVDPDEGLGG